MIEEIFVGILGLMFFGVLIYFFVKYFNEILKKEKLMLEKRDRIYDMILEKYSVSSDIENK